MRTALIFILLPLLSLAQGRPHSVRGENIIYDHRTLPKPLSVGDQLPTFLLGAHHSGLTIIDFWATWCGACLHSLPALDSLQREFGDSLQIILVTAPDSGDNAKKIAAFFKKHKSPSGASYHFALLEEDTIFYKLFPHKLIPHDVWIKDGRVIAITSAEEITAERIRKALSGASLALHTKWDRMDYNRHKPLFVDGNGGSGESLRFRSLVAGYIDGLPSGSSTDRDSSGRLTRICFVNTSLLELYRFAWGAYGPSLSVELQVSDTSKLKDNGGEDWKYDNSWSYELQLPPSSEEAFLKKMRGDLEQYFGYTGVIEKREGRTVFKIREKTGKDLEDNVKQ